MKRCSLIVCCLVLGGLAGIFLADPFLKGQEAAVPIIPEELTSYRDVVKRVLPAVVNIDSKTHAPPVRKGRRRLPMEDLPEGSHRFFELPSEFGDGDESPPPPGGFGSGFLVNAKGVILTNFHVIEREPDSVVIEKVGIEAVDLSADVADSLGYSEKAKGAVIAAVKRNSAADDAGLHQGMLVTKVEKKTIRSAQGLRDAIEAASLDRGVLLQIETPQGGANYVLLKSARD